MNISDLDLAVDPRDRAVNHIFRSALTLATILSSQRIEEELVLHLRDVIAELDAAVVTLRNAALAGIVRGLDVQLDTPPGDDAPYAAPGAVAEAGMTADGRRELCRFDDGGVFAYATHGHDFFRVRDHTLWAHESDGLLLSARSGTPLARRVRRAFHDIESNIPIYYERTE